MRILEDTQLYKGIFWIKDPDDISDSDDLCFQVPCDINGTPEIVDDYLLTSKDGKSFNHERTWKTLSRNLTDGQPYNYYPRGRVEINHGIATIYCSPHIMTDELRDYIKQVYNLTAHNGIKEIRMVADGSVHYHCYLD